MASDNIKSDKVVSLFEAIKKDTDKLTNKVKDDQNPESILEELVKKNKQKAEKIKKDRLKINRLVLKSYRLKF